jgi:hypothetical protein
MSPNDPQTELDSDHQEAVERRASASHEFPTNVTRSTQDLTTGGSEKDSHAEANTEQEPPHSSLEDEGFPPPSPEPTEAPTDRLSSSEQAVVQRERALETGKESPG